MLAAHDLRTRAAFSSFSVWPVQGQRRWHVAEQRGQVVGEHDALGVLATLLARGQQHLALLVGQLAERAICSTSSFGMTRHSHHSSIESMRRLASGKSSRFWVAIQYQARTCATSW